jgi:hypothetical protein
MTDITNKNFLSPLNFKFMLKRAPHVNFFIQKINIPGISLPQVETTNPFVNIAYAGDHLQYDTLEMTFKVDEDLQNYLEMHGWLRAQGKQSFPEYKALATTAPYTGEGLKSDISLTVLTSNKRANYEIVFKDAFPLSISSIDFNTTDEDVQHVLASVTFRYLYYDILKVNG